MMNFVGNHSIEIKLFDLYSGRHNGGLASLRISIIEEVIEEQIQIKKPKPVKDES